MSAIIRDSFKVNTLKNFITSISNNSIYMGIARPQFWDVVSNVDTTVPVPENTITHLNSDWDDMLALKLITVSDVSIGVFKETWQASVKYDTYRHDWNGSRASSYNGTSVAASAPQSLSDVKCYVITASSGIYMCLKRPVINSVVQASVYSPETGVAVGLNTGVVKTADGYYWKFIATALSQGNLTRFSSKYYHPVSTIESAPAPADPSYPQWVNQGYSANFKGGIYTIEVLTNGTGYNGGIAGTQTIIDAESNLFFKVIGNGTGLQYTVTYGATGSIVDIEVTNPGSGYTHATITAVGGANASFDIIFSPSSGLGVDPVKDLVARYLLINETLTGAEGGSFTILNDFRKILIVQNPFTFGTSSVATAGTLDASTKINVGTGLSLGAYPVDAIVTGGTSGAKGRVIDFNAVTGDIRIIRTSSENSNNLGANNSFIATETLTSSPGTGTASITATPTNPSVARYTGDIIYSEYRAPITRSELQTEDIKIVVKF